MSVSDPKKETVSEYSKFLKELGVTTQYSYQIKSTYTDSLSKSYRFCLNLYKYKKGTNASPVQIRMYNRSGNLVMGWEQCYGDLNYFKLFDSIPLRRISHLPNNYDIKIQNDLCLVNIEDDNLKELKKYISDHDFTIILFYSSWAGWYSKDAIKRTLKYVEHNNQIGLLFLNTANKS
jgi:hypothetical protein